MKYTYEIAKEYRQDLKALRSQHNTLLRKKALLKELKSNVDDFALYTDYFEKNKVVEADLKIVGEMISSTEYALFWIESGHERMPFEKRPITNLSKAQRTQQWGEIEHAKALYSEPHSEVSEWELAFIDDILSVLSERERDCYISVFGKLNTQEETAELLGIGKNSVKSYISRARKKIDHQLLYGHQGNVFATQ